MKHGAPLAVSGFLPLLLAATLLKSLDAGTIALAFEGFPDSTVLTSQYSGIAFSNAIILSAGVTLNEFEFPPHSGSNVASDNGGPVTISFSSVVESVSGYFTHSQPLTIQAFDSSNNMVASAASRFSSNEALSGGPGSAASEFLAVNASVSIAKVVITGATGGTSFTMDDLTLASFRQCVMSQDGTVTAGNVQQLINEALGASSATDDLNGDGVVNVTDVQIELNAALGLGCSAGPVAAPASLTQASAARLMRPALAGSDTIDAAGAAPSAIIQGTAQPVVFSARISDPKVISTGVNLVQVSSGGTEAVSGILQAGGSGAFSLTETFPSLSAGTLNFRISGPYLGLLRRIQTPIFSIAIVPAASTSGWPTVTPVGGYFTMTVPPELSMIDDPASGGYDTHTYDLVLSDGTIVAWLYVYTSAQWAAVQNLQTDAELPLLLPAGSAFVCAYVVSQNDGNALGFSENTVLSDLYQGLATLKAN